MKKIKILGLKGIRSELDILYSALYKMLQSDLLDVQLVFSGAHLSDWHGREEIADNYGGIKVCDRLDNLFMAIKIACRMK